MENRTVTRKSWAYLAFLGFCVFSALRDVLSEELFKDPQYQASPVFVIFVYCVVTQVLAAGILVGVGLLRTRPPDLRVRGRGKALFLLNTFTLLSYGSYFWAISTSLGAAVNAFIEYGSTPMVTALAGVLLLGERLSRRYLFASVACLLAIVLFGYQRLVLESISWEWYFGVALSLASSICGGMYRIYYKVLLNQGMEIAAVLFYRLIGLSLITGLILMFRPALFRPELLFRTAGVGICGFSVPLLLVLFVVKRLYIRSFALLLFLMPVLTYALSALMGYAQFGLLDVVAGLLMFAAIADYERRDQQSAPGAAGAEDPRT